MKILLTGKNGQLGFAINKKLTSLGEVIATDRHELNLENPDAIRAFIEKIEPDLIINAAAYTDVDKAELEILKEKSKHNKNKHDKERDRINNLDAKSITSEFTDAFK